METVGKYFARKQKKGSGLCYICNKQGEPAVYAVEHPEYYICKKCLMELRGYNPLLPLNTYVTEVFGEPRYITMAPELHEAIENVGVFFGPAVVFRAVSTTECRSEGAIEREKVIADLQRKLRSVEIEAEMKRRWDK